ncbi:SDR family oxidoreductase [Nocardia mikamii]|uniref:SDR family oxidoreductase n=1 Tax=Nocardia mikamii TaxID=508464 RepID=UPI0007A461DE|nr:SDR family oxidoreductase [Nocardia mikamii]
MTVLITGGSKGVGRACALRFATPGRDVFINYHADDSAAATAAAAVRERGAQPHLLQADLSTPDGMHSMMDGVAAKADHLGVVVHCAVDTSAVGGALDVDPRAFAAALQCNGIAVLTLTQLALPLLRRGSSIVFVTSHGAPAPVPGYVGVGAPKALGEVLAKYLAVELPPLGIRANCVMGSAMDTAAISSALAPGAAEERLRVAARDNPSGRRIEIDELVDAIEFLCSDRATMIQGQRLVVDGGYYLR